MSLLGFQVRTEDDLDLEPVVPDDIPAAVPAPAPLVPLEGDQMTQRGQMLAALTHAFRVARRNYLKAAESEGGMVHSLTHGQPPSLHDQHQYAKDHHWVPPGHDGGTLEGMGDIFQWLIALPGVAYGNSVSAIASKPFRACVAGAVSLVLANAGLYVTGHQFAAKVTDLGAVVLVALWAGAGWLLSYLKRLLSETTITTVPDDNDTEEAG